MIVAKFGGTSVNTAKCIKTICEIVNGRKQKPVVVVVSALAGVTNLLLSLPATPPAHKNRVIGKLWKMHKLLIENYFVDKTTQQEVMSYVKTQLSSLEKLAKNAGNDAGTLDKLASFGELLSSYLIACALTKTGIQAQPVLGTDLIVTNNNFGSAEFIPNLTKARVKKILLPLLKRGITPVVTGFIGATKDGLTTTLGRGGSDYTASIIGFCLGSSEIEIWTDVDGIFTADPQIVTDAKLIKTISFREASELATFGARVLHPRTIKPAIKAGIPVRVLNSFHPNGSGTLIAQRPKRTKPNRAVSFKRNITLVNIYSEEMLLQKGFFARIFSLFAKYDISVDLVSVSEVSVSITLDNEGMLEKVVSELKKFSSVSVKRHLGIVSVIGEGIAKSSHTVKEIFATLDTHAIEVKMVSLGATDINISLVVDNLRVNDTVKVLHDIIQL